MSNELYLLAEDILTSDTFKQMKNFSHHGKTSTLEHSINVAEGCLAYVDKHHINCDRRSLVVGCLLHDLFLYDYHEKRKRFVHWHAFRHPKIALKNAEENYQLTDLEREIIKKHMWPITIIPPTKKEAWVIVWQDKVCAIKELTHSKKTNR